MYSCKPITWQGLTFFLFLSCLLTSSYSFATERIGSSSSVLRIVYNENNPPFKFEGTDGESIGLLPDLWRLWAEKTGRQVEFIAAPWDQTLQMVQSGQADIHAGLFFTEDRDKVLDFSTSLFALEYYVFIHDTIRDVHNLKDLIPFRVGVPRGFTRQFMKQQLPDNAVTVYEDFPTLYEGAMRDEVRLFISPRYNYSDFLRRHGKTGYNRFFPYFPVYKRDYHAAVVEGNKRLLTEINEGMAKISAEELAAVEQKWLRPYQESPHQDILRISMSSDCVPLTFLDEEGEPSGLLVDMWRLWSIKTGRKVTFVPGTWKESIDAVASGRADVHSGLIKNKERASWLELSTPVYGVGSRFFFLADTFPVQTISEISGQKVGVVRGTWQQSYLLQYLSKQQVIAFEKTVNMVNALRMGEIELGFSEDLFIDEILNHQRLRGRIYGSRHRVIMKHIFAGVAQKNKGLLKEINAGFKQIPQTELLEIERRWIKDPTARFYDTEGQVILPRFSKREQIWLSRHQVISVAGIKNWAPIDFVDNEGIQRGITADYLNLIEKRLHITFRVHSELPWSEMLEQVEKHKIDIIANIVKTKDRSEFLKFSAPYFICPYATVSRRLDEQSVEKLDNMQNKKVVVEKDYYLHSHLRDEYPGIKLMVVNTTLQALDAVSREKAYAYIGNCAVSSWLIEEQQLQNLKIAENSTFAPTLLRFGVRSDWPELVSIFNKTLDTITQEEHLAIRKKWLGVNNQKERGSFESIRITSTEHVWLDSLKHLRLGVDDAWAPLEYLNNKGEYQGFSYDYMKRFSRQLGLKIAPVEKMSWSEVLERASAKDLDVIPMVIDTPEREKYLNFTQPYIDFPLVVFTRRDNEFISNIEDISDKQLAAVQGYITVDYLKPDYPDIKITKYPTVLDALKAVSFGKVDAYVGSLVVGSFLIEHEGLTNLKVAAPTPYKISLSIGVRKDWPHLVSLFNRAINSLTEMDKAAIRRNWLKVRYEHRVNYGLVWKILGVFLVIFMLMLHRNMEINRQKKLLGASEKQFKLLINALPIAIVVVDKNGIIIFDNSQAGYEIGNNKSLIGRNSEEFYADPADRLRILELLEKNGQVVGHHVKYRIDSGESIDCLLSVIPILFDGHDVLLSVTVNVTERIRMEQSMARAKKQAEEADHLKSAFLASMSHELRTPLNSIIGFTGILVQELAGPLNEEQKKQLSMVQNSSRHLLALINDVLDISKIEAGELKIFCEEFDIRQSLEKIIETLRPLASQKGLALHVDISPEISMIHSDPRRIEQILLNLIGNGIKFTDVGEVNIQCNIIKDDFLTIKIIDTGPGIKKQDIDKLFQTFKQIDSGVDRIHEGTGLGLSISKKLVEKLGGDIQVESKWGRGSTFVLRLPLNWL